MTYSSAVAPYPAAQNGFALDVSGDFNFGRVPDNAALAVQGDLTVETFFRLTTGYVFSGEGSGDTLVDKQSNSTGSGLILAAWWLGIQPIGGG